MNCWNRVVQTLAASGKPVLYTDFKYGGSGGFLTYTAAFLRSRASNVGFVSSSDLEDLLEAARCFTKLKRGEAAGDFATLTSRVRVARTREIGSRVVMPDAVRTLPIKECVERMRESKILAVRSQESGPARVHFRSCDRHVEAADYLCPLCGFESCVWT